MPRFGNRKCLAPSCAHQTEMVSRSHHGTPLDRCVPWSLYWADHQQPWGCFASVWTYSENINFWFINVITISILYMCILYTHSIHSQGSYIYFIYRLKRYDLSNHCHLHTIYYFEYMIYDSSIESMYSNLSISYILLHSHVLCRWVHLVFMSSGTTDDPHHHNDVESQWNEQENCQHHNHSNV